MVTLAIGLAVLGMALALHQIRLATHYLEAQAQRRAVQIASDARGRFDQERSSALQAVADKFHSDPDSPWQPPPNWPGWIDGLFLWDGLSLTTLTAPTEAPEGFTGWAGYRFRDEVEPGGPGHELIYDATGETPSAIACGRYTDAERRPIVIAARVHLGRIRAVLIEPLILPDDGLEVVPRENAAGPWFQPMFGVARSWAIQPTAAFLRDQRTTVIWLTVAYLSLSVLALATLLAAMWYLIRLTRREVVLAEMKSNFVADVSHELKTPLATIQLFAETLQSGRVTTEEKRQEYCATITRETTRLTNLIENILDFARIDAGRKAYTLEPSDIRKVIRDTYDAFVPQLEHNQFEHHLHMDDSFPPVDIDRLGISQVLFNLMSNAVKYSRDEHYLAVEVTNDTQRGCRGVLISVHDHGIGIRPEDRAHLFEGFFRAADSRVRERGGTGLGLALVKHIVDAHHGSLHAESRLVKGTTFRVFLPASENVEASKSQIA
jgi:signal transduction histidine kinase